MNVPRLVRFVVVTVRAPPDTVTIARPLAALPTVKLRSRAMPLDERVSCAWPAEASVETALLATSQPFCSVTWPFNRQVPLLQNDWRPQSRSVRQVLGPVGGFFSPYQIKRIAKADAEALKKLLEDAGAKVEVK